MFPIGISPFSYCPGTDTVHPCYRLQTQLSLQVLFWYYLFELQWKLFHASSVFGRVSNLWGALQKKWWTLFCGAGGNRPDGSDEALTIRSELIQIILTLRTSRGAYSATGKAFCNHIIMTVTAMAHAVLQAVWFQERQPLMAWLPCSEWNNCLAVIYFRFSEYGRTQVPVAALKAFTALCCFAFSAEIEGYTTRANNLSTASPSAR